MNAPLIFTWDGEVMRPAGAGWARRADKAFVVGERYSLVEEADRSQATHNHFFASLHDLWSNLPESMTEDFGNFEGFRKRGLIAKGYCTVADTVFSCEADAVKAAAIATGSDPYCVVDVRGQVVRIYRAESQSRRAMGAKRFAESKSAVLQWAADLVGVDASQAGKAA